MNNESESLQNQTERDSRDAAITSSGKSDRKGAPKGAFQPKSPALAGFLSLMPGLGQIYVGFYQLGFIYMAVVAVVITILSSEGVPALEPLFGFSLSFFWMYNIIDAVRRARIYNALGKGDTILDMPSDLSLPGKKGSQIGGIILFIFGFLLLLNTKFGVSMEWIGDWWPLGAMVLGGYLVYNGMKSNDSSNDNL